MKRTRIPLLLFVLLNCLVVTSCNNEEEVTIQDIDNIRVEFIELKEDLKGMIYTLKVQNNSNHVIIQNNVYVSFPIKVGNGAGSNEFKIEAKNNKINIKPGEEVLLTAFAPKVMYEGNSNIDVTNPDIEIKGYVDKLSERNRFHRGGSYKAMIKQITNK